MTFGMWCGVFLVLEAIVSLLAFRGQNLAFQGSRVVRVVIGVLLILGVI